MKTSIRSLSVLVVVLSLGVFGAGQVLAGGGSPSGLQDARDLARLRAAYVPDTAATGQLEQFQRLLAASPAESLLATADLSAARPVDNYAGQSVWLAPAADGGLCVFLPQPGDGRYAAACSTIEELNATGSISAVAGADGAALVVVVEPDGAADPVIVRDDGAAQPVALQANVAVARAEPGDHVSARGFMLEVPGR